jgi:hypothetical protein
MLKFSFLEVGGKIGEVRKRGRKGKVFWQSEGMSLGGRDDAGIEVSSILRAGL